MKAQQYWTAVYREERNRRCLDYREQSDKLGDEMEIRVRK